MFIFPGFPLAVRDLWWRRWSLRTYPTTPTTITIATIIISNMLKGWYQIFKCLLLKYCCVLQFKTWSLWKLRSLFDLVWLGWETNCVVIFDSFSVTITACYIVNERICFFLIGDNILINIGLENSLRLKLVSLETEMSNVVTVPSIGRHRQKIKCSFNVYRERYLSLP